MAYDINKALERLENNLKDVSTAKEQVDSIIICNKELKSVIEKYGVILSTLNKEIELWIGELKNFQNLKTHDFSEKIKSLESTLNATEQTFDTKVSACLVDFENNINSVLNKLSVENDKLSKEIDNLKPVTTTTDSVLKETQGAVALLNEISAKIKDTNSSNIKALMEIKSSFEELSANHNEFTALLNKEFSDVRNVLRDYEGTLYRYFGENEVKIKNITNSIDSVFSGVDDIKKGFLTNRIILILGLLILIILHFI